MAEYTDVLTELGFQDTDHDVDPALHTGGEYKLHGAWAKDDVKVICEQNSFPDAPGSETVITYPRVLVVESPKGRASVRPTDLDALRDVVKDLS